MNLSRQKRQKGGKHVKQAQRTLAFILSALMVSVSLWACSGDGSDDSAETTIVDSKETTANMEVDPLAGLDFDGAAFRVYISVLESYGVPTAAPLIMALESDGEMLNDITYQRNLATMEKLGVKFRFTECTLNNADIGAHLRSLILSGEDAHDLIINDVYGTVDLGIEGLFLNANDGKYFDFTKDYWAYDYMQDMTLDSDKIYILNGDYFLDAICNAHALFVNVDAYEDRFGTIDKLYEEVNTNTWTLDRMSEYVSGSYEDLDGDGAVTTGDFYGYIIPGAHGSLYPYVFGSDIPLITRDKDGTPRITMNDERTVNVYMDVYDLFYSPGTNFELFNVPGVTNPDYMTKFSEGGALFLGFSRVSSLATFREMEDSITIIPYPLLTDTQDRYITVTDDEVELGSIPRTTTQLDMISAVLEDLNATTGDTVLKAYYETALKVKYTRDDVTAQMLDLITDGLISSFPLAYNHCLNGIFLEPLRLMVSDKSTDFASYYASLEGAAKTLLDDAIEAYRTNK